MVRQDWLDTAGVEVPETIDQLIEVATAIEQKGLYGDKGYAIGAQKELTPCCGILFLDMAWFQVHGFGRMMVICICDVLRIKLKSPF